MPIGIGSSSTADVTVTPMVITIGASGRANLFMGWARPTDATNPNCLIGCSAPYKILVAADAAELSIITDNATTDGQWDTSGAGFVDEEWRFFAVMSSHLNTGPAGAVRVWTGSVEVPPAEVTVTQIVAPVGNFSGGSDWVIGNDNGDDDGYGGELANAVAVNTNAGAGVTTHPLGLAALGVITDNEADNLLRRLVTPYWAGDTDPLMQLPSASLEVVFHPLQTPDAAYGKSASSATLANRGTTGNATAVGTACPRPYLQPLLRHKPQACAI